LGKTRYTTLHTRPYSQVNFNLEIVSSIQIHSCVQTSMQNGMCN